MHTAFPGISSLPRDIPIMQTYDRIQAAFPGGPLPAVVAVEADDVTSPEFEAALADFREQALATGQMEDPIQVQVNDDETVAIVSVPLAGTGTDDASTEALLTLREDVIPATIGAVDGVDVAVAGEAASSYDFSQLTKDRAPIVFAFVLLFAFGLLLVAFRSIVIAAKAVVLNLLSVAAAYGLLVIVFQWGWGESLLGFDSTGAITAWLPLFMFVILFGLSMDYHVFILSRIREAYDRGLDTDAAIAHGIKTTAGVVTAAAIVMVAVFSIFATLSTIDMKQAGVGLAAAILIDATIVRARAPALGHEAARRLELVPAELARVAAAGLARDRGRPEGRGSGRPPAASPRPVQGPRPLGGAGLSRRTKRGRTRGGARCGGAPPRRPWAYEPGRDPGAAASSRASGPRQEGTPLAAEELPIAEKICRILTISSGIGGLGVGWPCPTSRTWPSACASWRSPCRRPTRTSPGAIRSSRSARTACSRRWPSPRSASA